jgi:AmmeMemoRadiSam system protein B
MDTTHFDTPPKARTDIDFVRVATSKGEMMLVRDPLGLAGESTMLSPTAVAVLSLLDGSRSLSDIQYMLTRAQGGVIVSSNEVKRILDTLSQHFLLQDDRYRKAKSAIASEYSSKPVREPVFSGSAYPSDSGQLRAELESILSVEEPSDVPTGDLTGIVAPHIDIAAGRASYGRAYGCLRGAEPEKIVVLGTGHNVPGQKFSLTSKDYSTPLGVAETDRTVVDLLMRRHAGALHEDDLPHRSEHSIEFQMIFLQHILGSNLPKIVPILCGSFSGVLQTYSRPAEIPEVGDFLESLSEIVRSQKTLVVAGVDLSHVGRKFGDQSSAYSVVEESRPHDESLLKALCSIDVESLWAESRRVSDRYHVCGFSALASLLEILPPSEATLLSYEISHEDSTMSAVSFASAVFTSAPGPQGGAS